jgi:hypothetical protein
MFIGSSLLGQFFFDLKKFGKQRFVVFFLFLEIKNVILSRAS